MSSASSSKAVATPKKVVTEAHKALFLDKVKRSNAACQAGQFQEAVRLYSEALELDPDNHVLHSNRSAALLKLGRFKEALQDAARARQLSPQWPKAYFRQGVALQCLGRHSEALSAFASGLAQDPKSQQLLSGLVEAAMKSPLRASLEPTYRQLESMKLDRSPFVLISVVGQELLAQGKFRAAVEVLESALRIGTCSLKLRGSVFSALSSAYWALNNLDKAIGYMQQDLVVAKQLSDVAGECRAHGNLGSAYFSRGDNKDALTAHRYQLVLAMKCRDDTAASTALTSLGHVYAAEGDYANALASHKQCLELIRQHSGDSAQEARELGNVGSVYLAMGDFEKAVECHTEHLRIAVGIGSKVEEARAHSNLGSCHHYRRNFEQAVQHHQQVLRLAKDIGDKAVEARAYAGLGHAARCLSDHGQAREWHEKQLEMALATKDKIGEGRACSNLGIVFQLLGDHDAALKLHQAHLNIARSQRDRAGMGRAFGNIGNAYSAGGYYEQAIKYHKQELGISKEVGDRSSEASTHGNLAVAYQALGAHEMALVHYHSHLNIARELKDSAGEALALCNLGNCHSSRHEFAQAVPFYENYLMLSQELSDVEGEAKACHFLGYAHYRLGSHREAVRYYDQDLALARDQQDRTQMARAYCNLGLAHLEIGNLESALECQKYFLAMAESMKHMQGRFRALGNLGEVLSRLGRLDEAVAAHNERLNLARSPQMKDRASEAAAFGALGSCHRMARQFDKALGYHTQELSLLQDLGDMRGECLAHAHLGAVHLSLGNYIAAAKCYREQLDRARDVRDPSLEAQAQGNLGITRLGLGRHEEAIACFEQQLAAMEQLSGGNLDAERGRAYGNLGACYDALGDYEEAIGCHEKQLQISLKCGNAREQDRAYRELGAGHKKMGNLQQALVCFEKRLVVAHDLDRPDAKTSAYGELGEVHTAMGSHEQALQCYDNMLTAARESGDKHSEALAASGMGLVHHRLRDWSSSLRFHRLDEQISRDLNDVSGLGRSLANLGETYESMEEEDKAMECFEGMLQVAADADDVGVKTRAFENLGRLHHTLGNLSAAIGCLEQGLDIASGQVMREEEARIRHRLGMALWQAKDQDRSRAQLEQAASILESVRRETPKGVAEKRMELFDLQTECYQALQRVLVRLGREEDALVVAEKARNRAMADLVRDQGGKKVSNRLGDRAPTSVSEIVTLVNRQKASVLYFSLAAGYLYIWLIVPTKGIVKFHQVRVSGEDEEDDDDNECSFGFSLLTDRIKAVRESLGVINSGSENKASNDNVEGDEDNMWSSHLDALGDKLNQEGDRSGFLRMVNRGSRLNASTYSLSSLFSVGSVGCGSTVSGVTAVSSKHHGSTRSRRRNAWQGPQALRKLYELLLEPLEDDMPEGYPCELTLVLEGELYLVPWAMLKSPHCPETLSEKYNLIVAPSLTSLKTKNRNKGFTDDEEERRKRMLVVGNPKIPSAVSEQWGWADIPHSAQEASLISEVLQSPEPLVGDAATKEAVLSKLSQAECIHLACHVSWKLSAIVFSPGEFVDSSKNSATKRYSINSDTIHEEEDVKSEVASSGADLDDAPSLSEFLLTAADILNMKLNAKLVVISSCHTRDETHGAITSDGLISLTRALLAAGVQCVMVSLWPVPIAAVKIVMKAFYSSLLQGSKTSRALSEATATVQSTKQMQHPANWAGFVLIGSDVKINNKEAMLGQALKDLLAAPDTCRDALRVTLHLVEKSLQRIHRGCKNAMYTSQRSIENKVGHDDKNNNGWKDLLISVGFRLEPGANGVPASVFFPQSDPGERLTQASASLQAILGLSQTSWRALAKIVNEGEEAADEIIALFRQILAKYNDDDAANAEVSASVRVWRTPGCHELLASLGFDLMGVGDEEVRLRGGKSAGKRQAQFALQSLLALFDTQDAPRCIEVDEDDSSEDAEDASDNSDESPAEEMPTQPFPAPRKTDVVLSEGGAFTSYVRRANRGEPDGRQAGNGDSPPASAYPSTTTIPPPPLPPTVSSYPTHSKGHESDCNFTPSPVNSVPRQQLYKGLYGHQFSQQPHNHAGPFNYGQQRRISTSDNSPAASDKISSANSSLADWKPRPNSVHLQNRFEQAMNGLTEAIGGNCSSNGSSSGYAPLYENSNEATYSARQPAGRPVMPVRSVFTDVGYGSTQKITDKSYDPNDKFSVRAEAGKSHPGLKQPPSIEYPVDARLNPGVTKRVPPTGESDSPESTMNNNVNKRASMINADTASVTTTSSANTFIVKSDDGGYGHTHHKKLDSNASSTVPIDLSEINIHDSIRSTQLRRLTRDNIQFPIQETFHDKNNQNGLGLAPPLSTIIMSNNLQVVQVDHHSDSEGSSKNASFNLSSPVNNVQTKEESFNNFDNTSAIEAVHLRGKLQDPPSKRRPPVPPKPHGEWNGNMPPPPPPPVRPMARDEGDGRSMTDSQYSGYSPNGQPPKLNGHHHVNNVDKVSARMGYLKMQDYINQQDIITVVEEDEKQSQQSGPISNVGKLAGNFERRQNVPPPIASPRTLMGQKLTSQQPNLVNANTKHPAQIWSRDKTGGLHYTGMFSSDC